MKKMMFKIVGLVFALIMVLTMCTNVYARSNNDNVAAIESLIEEIEGRNYSYYSQIETIMKEPDVSNNVRSYDINNAYRVTMMEPLLLTILNDGQEFKNTLTDVIQWKVPIITDEGEPGLVFLLEKEGELSYIGKHTGETTKVWHISMNGIREAVRDAAEFDGKIYSIQIAHSYVYNTAFVYMDGEKNDYIILYSLYSKETGLENGKVYILSEFTKEFNKCFDEKVMIDNPSHNGGVPFRTLALDNRILVIATLLAFAGGVIVVWFRLKKKSRIRK